QLARADRVLIGLHNEGQTLYIPAEVRHWRALGGDLVELGCRFAPESAIGPPDEVETPEDVAAAVGRLLERIPVPRLREDDRRLHQRVQFTERIEIHAPGKPPLFGYSRDLSKGGVSFLTTAPLPHEVTLIFAPTA